MTWNLNKRCNRRNWYEVHKHGSCTPLLNSLYPLSTISPSVLLITPIFQGFRKDLHLVRRERWEWCNLIRTEKNDKWCISDFVKRKNLSSLVRLRRKPSSGPSRRGLRSWYSMKVSRSHSSYMCHSLLSRNSWRSNICVYLSSYVSTRVWGKDRPSSIFYYLNVSVKYT